MLVIWSHCEDSAKNRKDFKGINSWDTSNVENMFGMFYVQKDFNEPLNSWNTSRVKNMWLCLGKHKILIKI